MLCAIPDRKIINAVFHEHLLNVHIAELCAPGKLFFIPPGFKSLIEIFNKVYNICFPRKAFRIPPDIEMLLAIVHQKSCGPRFPVESFRIPPDVEILTAVTTQGAARLPVIFFGVPPLLKIATAISCQVLAIRPIKSFWVPPFNEVKTDISITTLEKTVNKRVFTISTDSDGHRDNAKTNINSIPARLVMKTTHPVFSIIVFLSQAVAQALRRSARCRPGQTRRPHPAQPNF